MGCSCREPELLSQHTLQATRYYCLLLQRGDLKPSSDLSRHLHSHAYSLTCTHTAPFPILKAECDGVHLSQCWGGTDRKISGAQWSVSLNRVQPCLRKENGHHPRLASGLHMHAHARPHLYLHTCTHKGRKEKKKIN